jgi:hypothetical protein
MLDYLRALTLLVAFGIGLLGQAAATVAMPMPMQMSQDVAALSSSADDSGNCQGCARHDGPAMPAMGANCIFALCLMSPAVLPSGPIVASPVRESVQPVAVRDEAGITIRPDLGPPRLTHRS